MSDRATATRAFHNLLAKLNNLFCIIIIIVVISSDYTACFDVLNIHAVVESKTSVYVCISCFLI